MKSYDKEKYLSYLCLERFRMNCCTSLHVEISTVVIFNKDMLAGIWNNKCPVIIWFHIFFGNSRLGFLKKGWSDIIMKTFFCEWSSLRWAITVHVAGSTLYLFDNNIFTYIFCVRVFPWTEVTVACCLHFLTNSKMNGHLRDFYC